jgi:hypothetical protein
MSASVEYRHEYVTGAIAVAAESFPVLIVVRVVNRGGSPGRARVRVWNEHLLLPESEDGQVEPDGVWPYNAPAVELQGIDARGNSIWVQIRTTLPELVPTLSFQETVRSPEGEVEGVRESHFLAPGDFASFALHPAPFHPPLQPPVDAP